MNIVLTWLWLSKNCSFNELLVISRKCKMFTKDALQEMPLGCSPCGAIFYSVLAANIADYVPLPKTFNLTPPELMRKAGEI